MGLFRKTRKTHEQRYSAVYGEVEPSRVARPMCNDDDGMLISQVVDSVMRIDTKGLWHSA